jgi:uncharacterized repeat protein (TIGR01451 family)
MNRQQLLALVLLMSLAPASGIVVLHGSFAVTQAPTVHAEQAPVRHTVRERLTTNPLPVQRAAVEASPQRGTALPATQSETGPATPMRLRPEALNLPLRFIANAGQTDPAVCFTVKGAGHTLFFTSEEVVLSAVQEGEGGPVRSVVRLRFPGANPSPVIEGLAPMPGVVNYFLGNDPAQWQANVPTHGAVTYRDLYPGIDLVYRGSEGILKSEFHVAPEGDPAAIMMAYSGLEGMYLREDGALVLQTALGQLVEESPLIYQEVGGIRREIPGGYVPIFPLESEVRREEDVYRVRFQVAAYDTALPLVIDPALAYSTYVGGDSNDYGQDIAVDGGGNVYITGYTYASDFPVFNEIQTNQDYVDAFVTHLTNASGVYTYGYSTYLGGNDVDYGHGIAVDGAGGAYVTGSTESDDFPSHNPVQTDHGGGTYDAFVTQIISAGGSYTLAYSTYLGGSNDDLARDIAVDGAGDAYVVGYTHSSDFPTTANAIQTDQAGADAFVTGIVDAGGAYVYSTYLGGGGNDRGWGIAVNGAGDAYVTGYTASSDFPSHNAIQPNRRGLDDAFVTQIIEAGGVYTYAYSTYLGGQSADQGNDISVNSAGDACVTGYTISSDFPTHRAIQPSRAGGYDAFVTQIISASEVYTYAYSTYLGGGDEDRGQGIAVDDVGNAYVTGITYSDDFPTRHPIQTDQGTFDAFVTEIISASEVYTYAYSTYLGGSGGDRGQDIAVDNSGNAYVTGYTSSNDFPTRHGTQQYQGSTDALVSVIVGIADLAISKLVTPHAAAPGGTVTYTLVYTNDSYAAASGILITDLVPITLTQVSVDRSGALITPTGSVDFTWEVEPLSPGAGGVITISGVVDPAANGVFSLTNQASITTTDVMYVETSLDNNASVVSNTVDAELPLPPTLISPANGAIISDTTPILIWQFSPSPDVAGYLLDWNSAIADVGDVTQYSPGNLVDGVNTWTVAAYDAVGNTSAYTDVWSFTGDATPPDPPTLVSPANGGIISDTTPALTWEASPSPDVAGYVLDWDGLVADVGGTTQQTVGVLADGAYTWTVAAYDGVCNTGSFTDVWSFAVDAMAPEILDTAPVSGAVGVAVDAAVVITFSEAIEASAFDHSVSPDPGGWAASWGSGGAILTLAHNPFAYRTTYNVTVTKASDLAGNPLVDAPVGWGFTTFDPGDVTPPEVLATYPTGGAVGVAVDAAIVITFSEAINAGTFTYGVLPDPGGWHAVWGSGEAVVTLTHNPFAHRTMYTITVIAASDPAGNPLAAAPVAWQFTTAKYSVYLPVVLREPGS